MSDIWMLTLLCTMTFIAGFIDAVAGGGGLISLPAYLLAGLPPHLAVGGNKLSACSGTLFALLRFWKHKKIRWREALTGMGGAFAGSGMGSLLALVMRGDQLRILIVAALPVVGTLVFVSDAFKRDPAPDDPRPGLWKSVILAFSIGFGIGVYDGLIGPGTGTFLIIASVWLLKLDLVTASGNAKVINFASNFASVLVFGFNGSIPYAAALPAAGASIVGGYLGVGFCVRHGSRGVRRMLVVVLALLFVRLAWDVCRHLF